MRTAAVGQKCPSCARTPRSARALGKPEHYVRAVGVGVLAALAGGLLYAQLLVAIPFGGFILAGVLGFALGRIVRWGSRGQTQPPFPAIAMGLAAIGVAVAFVLLFGSPLPGTLFRLLAYPVAVWLAARGLQG